MAGRLAHAEPESLLSYGTDWLYLLVPLAALGAVASWLVLRGQGGQGSLPRRWLLRAGSSLERLTGLPAWCSGALLVGAFALGIAAMGWVWDVAWHLDLGRDEFILTPAHLAILTGLMLIVAAAALSVALATVMGTTTRWRVGRLRVPIGAVPLAALGLGALVGFPLDEFWHRAYGIDVTMWGPTHLLMISGASFAPLALWLLLAEAGPEANRVPFARARRALLAGVVLTGLSTFQLEFDLGVPQFQQLYHPVLIALAGSIGLVAARAALGRGGAVIAAVGFIAVRGALAVLVGPVLGLTLPRFPLYLGAALGVEAAFALESRLRPTGAALLAGAAVGTVGLASEWGWMAAWGHHPWGASLWPGVLPAVGGAVPGALLGLAIGRVLGFRTAGVRAGRLALAGLVVVALLALPLPRRPAPVRADIWTRPAGPDRVMVELSLRPPDAADGADWFEVLSWQGGGSAITPLEPVGGGRFRTAAPVPVGEHWKTGLRLARHDVMVGLPISMPADPAIGPPEVPVRPYREGRFVRERDVLIREARDGPAWPAVVAYSLILGLAVGWIALLAVGFAAVGRRWARPDGRLTGRRILLTGALGGIGSAAVEALRREGARVMGIDLVAGPDVLAADVRDPAALSAAVREAARRMGGIDTLVNNAGIGRAQDSGELPGAESRRVIEVNLFGTWIATAAALPDLLAERGHVVNVASGLAIATVPYAAAYAASKRGVAAYSDVLRMEYRGRLTVTTVFPGYIRTPIHDVPAAQGASLDGLVWEETVNQAAGAIVRACADRPREVAVSARTAVGLWLARHAPGLADAVVWRRFRRLMRTRPTPAFVRRDDRVTDLGKLSRSEP